MNARFTGCVCPLYCMKEVGHIELGRVINIQEEALSDYQAALLHFVKQKASE